MQEINENELRPSVWRQTEEGCWKLFFNLNEEAVQKVEHESQINFLDRFGEMGLEVGWAHDLLFQELEPGGLEGLGEKIG